MSSLIYVITLFVIAILSFDYTASFYSHILPLPLAHIYYNADNRFYDMRLYLFYIVPTLHNIYMVSPDTLPFDMPTFLHQL